MSSRSSGPRPPRGLAYRALGAYSSLSQRLRGGPRPFRDTGPQLLDEASRRTGLSDYGDARFRAGLDVLLESYDAEARLNPFGRMNVREELLGVLSARLALIDQWKRNPDVLEAPIERPIFIVGLPRTGTSIGPPYAASACCCNERVLPGGSCKGPPREAARMRSVWGGPQIKLFVYVGSKLWILRSVAARLGAACFLILCFTYLRLLCRFIF